MPEKTPEAAIKEMWIVPAWMQVTMGGLSITFALNEDGEPVLRIRELPDWPKTFPGAEPGERVHWTCSR